MAPFPTLKYVVWWLRPIMTATQISNLTLRAGRPQLAEEEIFGIPYSSTNRQAEE